MPYEWLKGGNDTKPCSKCGKWFPLEAFTRNRRAYLGRSSWCKACHRKSVRAWRAKHRDEENALRRERYRQAHPLPDRHCIECGDPIVDRNAGAIVCGKRCRELRKNRQRRQKARAAATYTAAASPSSSSASVSASAGL